MRPIPWLSWLHPLALLLAILLADQATAIDYWPMSIPLAVKTPYLSSWMKAGLTQTDPSWILDRNWPINGYDAKTTAWAGLAMIDGVEYSWLGDGGNGSTLTAGNVQSVKVEPCFYTICFQTLTIIQITPTQTQFIVRCGKVDLNVTFLSPIEPKDFVRMSLPFSYLSVVASPNDGQQHHVQIYSEITGGKQLSPLLPSRWIKRYIRDYRMDER
jgi:hypothetical protein